MFRKINTALLIMCILISLLNSIILATPSYASRYVVEYTTKITKTVWGGYIINLTGNVQDIYGSPNHLTVSGFIGSEETYTIKIDNYDGLRAWGRKALYDNCMVATDDPNKVVCAYFSYYSPGGSPVDIYLTDFGDQMYTYLFLMDSDIGRIYWVRIIRSDVEDMWKGPCYIVAMEYLTIWYTYNAIGISGYHLMLSKFCGLHHYWTRIVQYIGFSDMFWGAWNKYMFLYMKGIYLPTRDSDVLLKIDMDTGKILLYSLPKIDYYEYGLSNTVFKMVSAHQESDGVLNVTVYNLYTMDNRSTWIFYLVKGLNNVKRVYILPSNYAKFYTPGLKTGEYVLDLSTRRVYRVGKLLGCNVSVSVVKYIDSRLYLGGTLICNNYKALFVSWSRSVLEPVENVSVTVIVGNTTVNTPRRVDSPAPIDVSGPGYGVVSGTTKGLSPSVSKLMVNEVEEKEVSLTIKTSLLNPRKVPVQYRVYGVKYGSLFLADQMTRIGDRYAILGFTPPTPSGKFGLTQPRPAILVIDRNGSILKGFVLNLEPVEERLVVVGHHLLTPVVLETTDTVWGCITLLDIKTLDIGASTQTISGVGLCFSNRIPIHFDGDRDSEGNVYLGIVAYYLNSNPESKVDKGSINIQSYLLKIGDDGSVQWILNLTPTIPLYIRYVNGNIIVVGHRDFESFESTDSIVITTIDKFGNAVGSGELVLDNVGDLLADFMVNGVDVDRYGNVYITAVLELRKEGDDGKSSENAVIPILVKINKDMSLDFVECIGDTDSDVSPPLVLRDEVLMYVGDRLLEISTEGEVLKVYRSRYSVSNPLIASIGSSIYVLGRTSGGIALLFYPEAFAKLEDGNMSMVGSFMTKLFNFVFRNTRIAKVDTEMVQIKNFSTTLVDRTDFIKSMSEPIKEILRTKLVVDGITISVLDTTHRIRVLIGNETLVGTSVSIEFGSLSIGRVYIEPDNVLCGTILRHPKFVLFADGDIRKVVEVGNNIIKIVFDKPVTVSIAVSDGVIMKIVKDGRVVCDNNCDSRRDSDGVIVFDPVNLEIYLYPEEISNMKNNKLGFGGHIEYMGWMGILGVMIATTTSILLGLANKLRRNTSLNKMK